MPNKRRRSFLQLSGIAALAGCSSPPGAQGDEDKLPSALGRPISAYGERSQHETAKRVVPELKRPQIGSTRTPLAAIEGIITPSSLHFERHHAGVPDLNPETHTLLIHGLVERPLVFSVAELKRLPSASHIYFVECSGNSGGEWKAPGGPTAAAGFGLASCSEWTGVPLQLLLEEAGLKKEGKWLVAEGADACKMSRSLPIEKALDDCLVAYAQNGEAIRPEQGYPLRLVVPGYEGNVNVKWLRQIKVVDQPNQTKDETSKYTDLLADGSSRQFTFLMDAKSVITTPSGGQKLSGPGFQEIRGLAWSGRGVIERVEVSTDAGKTWQRAILQEPRLPKAFTRFRLPWTWDGQPAEIVARATDGTGYVQPTREELVEARGINSAYHYNGLKSWKIAADGSVKNG
ncbi:MAG TPA: sulfite dehydrogenase [Bryobacteraceae bacterium]|nr:sulfite dehydrogenase [Bryobacteraceae bacterium]